MAEKSPFGTKLGKAIAKFDPDKMKIPVKNYDDYIKDATPVNTGRGEEQK